MSALHGHGKNEIIQTVTFCYVIRYVAKYFQSIIVRGKKVFWKYDLDEDGGIYKCR